MKFPEQSQPEGVGEDMIKFAKAMRERRVAMHKAVFPLADADGDGKLTKEEFDTCRSHTQKLSFAEADADGDGAVTMKELKAFLPAPPPQPAGRGCGKHAEGKECGKHAEGKASGKRAEGKGCGKHAEGRGCGKRVEGRGCGKHRPADAFQRADTDQDGKLSPEEWESIRPFPHHGRHCGKCGGSGKIEAEG